MTFTYRVQLIAGMIAATFCLMLTTSNQAVAQVVAQRAGITQSYYSPYGEGFNTGYRTGNQIGRTYRYRDYGGHRGSSGYRGYSEYGQGPYGYGLQGGYVDPPAATSRRGDYYRRGSSSQFRTYGSPRHGNAPQYYSPYGYGRN